MKEFHYAVHAEVQEDGSYKWYITGRDEESIYDEDNSRWLKVDADTADSDLELIADLSDRLNIEYSKPNVLDSYPIGKEFKELNGRCEDAPCCGCCGDWE